MNWNEFVPSAFEYDFENDKLAYPGITIDEAIQCFLNEFLVLRNKKFKDRWQLIGRTDSGRKLKIIFQLKHKNVV